MEIVGEDGSAIELKDGAFKAVFGRGSGFNTKDRTVCRRHVLFRLRSQTEPRVSFEVVGKNPLWLRSGGGGDGERKIRVFKKLEKGEMEAGDCFCISSQSPVWYNVKKIEVERLSGNSESLDISQIDPVKEFGFLVMGHEFDCYPKQRMRNPRNWDWFLEETKKGEDSDDDDDDDDDDENKRKRSGRRKRKKNEDEDDDEWSDESEDMETAAKIKRVDRPKYSTRSKDKNKGKQRKAGRSKMEVAEEQEEDEDDDDLGGFIVTDEEGGGGEEDEGGENDEEEGEEEEEEELMEDEEEEELDE